MLYLSPIPPTSKLTAEGVAWVAALGVIPMRGFGGCISVSDLQQ